MEVIPIQKHASVRSILMMLLVAVFFGAYVLKLFDLQIVHGQYYRDLADSTATRTISVEAARGEILDRNGKELAVNRMCRSIIFDRNYMTKGTENETILRLTRLLTGTGEEWIDNLPIYLDTSGTYQFEENADKEIESLKNYLRVGVSTSAEDCMYHLIEKFECTELSREDALTVVSVRYEMDKRGFSATVSYTFAQDISVDTVSIVSENSDSLPGVKIENTTIREYPNGDLAPHTVGIVAAIDEDEYKEKKDDGYTINDTIGKFGVEQAMESYLRGTRGTRIIETSNTGAYIDTTDVELPKPGNTVTLTLNSELQKASNEALQNIIEEISSNGKLLSQSTGKTGYGEDCTAGAIVVLDVNTFEVLALSTFPSFDLSNYQEDLTDPTKSFVNRTLSGEYPPGSVMKPAIALAGLEEGVIEPTSRLTCNRFFEYYGSTFQCLGYHGSIAVPLALRDSCNIFFYQVADKLGISKMNDYCKRLGLGVPTGLELSGNEASGILAGPEEREKRNELYGTNTPWYPGDTLQAAIGQSDNLFTPIQLAAYTATIANGGTRYQTRLIKSISDYSRSTVIQENTSAVLDQLNVDPENMEAVQYGMRLAMASGSASYALGNYPIPLAGKTGTAQASSGSDHGLLACYAPYDEPEIAVVIVLEHAAHGYSAAPAMKQILDCYFKLGDYAPVENDAMENASSSESMLNGGNE